MSIFALEPPPPPPPPPQKKEEEKEHNRKKILIQAEYAGKYRDFVILKNWRKKNQMIRSKGLTWP